MSLEEPDNTPTEEETKIAQFGLPIEHLFMVDPLDIGTDDLLLLVNHYRNQRFNFIKAQNERPARVEKTRDPKLDKEASEKEIKNIMAALFDDDPDA